MSASAFQKPSLRPYLASDLPLLAEIRFAAIEELTVEDYDEAQRQAWAATDDDEFAQRLENGLTLVALIGGGPVGFIAMQRNGLIDQLYVHPAVARTGVASVLAAEHRHTIEINGQWLGNTRMKKMRAPKSMPDGRQ